MKPPDMYLTRRPENGVWYFRRPIPKRLQPFVNCGNKQTFTISLKTTKLTEARPRHHEHWMESERVLKEAEKRAKAAESGGASVRPGNGPVDSLKRRGLDEFKEAELVALVQRWFLEESATRLEECRAVFNYWTPEERKERIAEEELRLTRLQRREGAEPDFETYAAKRKVLEDAGGEIVFPHRHSMLSKDQKLTGLIREALIRLTQHSLEILKTGVPPVLDAGSPEFSSSSLAAVTQSAKSITLDELISIFEKDAKQREVRAKSLDEFALVYSILRGFLDGKTALSDITRAQMRELRDLYAQLPPNASKRFRNKTLRETASLAQKAKLAPMATATLNKRVALISRVFQFAADEGLIAKNPAKSLRFEKKKQTAGYKVFTVPQLQRIFSGPIFQAFAEESDARLQPNHRLEPHKFWAPLVGLFQGMRMGEILQLRTDDVLMEDCIHCLQVTDLGDGQELKTTASRRTIPIHPILKQLGFLQFVENTRKAGKSDIFSDAPHGKTYGNRSHNYSKKFNRYLADIGVKSGPSECFHSFRHTFTDGLRNAGVTQDMIRRLGGWTDTGSLESSYGGRLQPHLHSLLSKLEYGGLDLSHLLHS